MKTPIACSQLNISEARLNYLIRSRKIPAPSKDTSGDYIWTEGDLARARLALQIDRRRTREPLTCN
jgi:hypothetical protein